MDPQQTSRRQQPGSSEIPIDPGILLDVEEAQSGPDPEATTASSGQPSSDARLKKQHLARGGAQLFFTAELDIGSFGMQLLDLPAGFSDYPEHDHSADGMEEVYVVLDGAAVFEIDGERVPLDRDRMLRVTPDARRKLHPGPEGVRILAIGSTLSRPYERPDAFRLKASDSMPT